MIKTVVISKDLVSYLENRKIDKQYRKAKKYILDWFYKNVNLKVREPKSEWIYYFRINKQYRALCKLENDVLKVFDIDNHQ